VILKFYWDLEFYLGGRP